MEFLLKIPVFLNIDEIFFLANFEIPKFKNY